MHHGLAIPHQNAPYAGPHGTDGGGPPHYPPQAHQQQQHSQQMQQQHQHQMHQEPHHQQQFQSRQHMQQHLPPHSGYDSRRPDEDLFLDRYGCYGGSGGGHNGHRGDPMNSRGGGLGDVLASAGKLPHGGNLSHGNGSFGGGCSSSSGCGMGYADGRGGGYADCRGGGFAESRYGGYADGGVAGYADERCGGYADGHAGMNYSGGRCGDYADSGYAKQGYSDHGYGDQGYYGGGGHSAHGSQQGPGGYGPGSGRPRQGRPHQGYGGGYGGYGGANLRGGAAGSTAGFMNDRNQNTRQRTWQRHGGASGSGAGGRGGGKAGGRGGAASYAGNSGNQRGSRQQQQEQAPKPETVAHDALKATLEGKGGNYKSALNEFVMKLSVRPVTKEDIIYTTRITEDKLFQATVKVPAFNDFEFSGVPCPLRRTAHQSAAKVALEQYAVYLGTNADILEGQEEGVESGGNYKSELNKIVTRFLRRPLTSEDVLYCTVDSGSDGFRTTVVVGTSSFQGEVLPRKKDAEQSAAQKAVEYFADQTPNFASESASANAGAGGLSALEGAVDRRINGEGPLGADNSKSALNELVMRLVGRALCKGDVVYTHRKIGENSFVSSVHVPALPAFEERVEGEPMPTRKDAEHSAARVLIGIVKESTAAEEGSETAAARRLLVASPLAKPLVPGPISGSSPGTDDEEEGDDVADLGVDDVVEDGEDEMARTAEDTQAETDDPGDQVPDALPEQ
eukprot:TRINITY_DN10886_c0_g1_i1.p1 TRINITY_DN10886_c0_g1~~TRINITY_DN10886_c0_g1_i1.p1  ORF type:complete len:734 (-),score=132.30 TRINITY_DN10886_c0_g1_i1:162-2363(-)